MQGLSCPHCGREFQVTVQAVKAPLDNQELDDLNHQWSVRVWNALRNEGLHLVRDVAAIPDRELLKVKNFGKHSLAEVRAVIPYQDDPDRWQELRTWLAGFRRSSWNQQLVAINARVGRRIYEPAYEAAG